MKAEIIKVHITPPVFDPIELRIIIESDDELKLLLDLTYNVSGGELAKFLNRNKSDSSKKHEPFIAAFILSVLYKQLAQFKNKIK